MLPSSRPASLHQEGSESGGRCRRSGLQRTPPITCQSPLAHGLADAPAARRSRALGRSDIILYHRVAAAEPCSSPSRLKTRFRRSPIVTMHDPTRCAVRNYRCAVRLRPPRSNQFRPVVAVPCWQTTWQRWPIRYLGLGQSHASNACSTAYSKQLTSVKRL